MDDKEFAKQKHRVMALLIKWKPKLGLREWDTQIFWYRDPEDFPPEVAKDTQFGCLAHWEYMKANIYVLVRDLESVSDDRLKVMVVHEFMHTIVNPITNRKRSAEEELVCTMLANAFVSIEGGNRDKRKQVTKNVEPGG